MNFGKRMRDPSGYHEPMTANPDIAAVINGEPRQTRIGLRAVTFQLALLAGGIILAIGILFVLYTIVSNALLNDIRNAQGETIDTGLHAKVAEMCGGGNTTLAHLKSEAAMMGLARPPRSADFLNCAMTKFPERLCELESRVQMARDLSIYVDFHERRKIEYDRFMSNPQTRQIARMGELMNNAKNGLHNSARQPVGVDPSVIAKMQQLIRDGYLSASDFGMLPPTHMEPYLAGIFKEKELCR